MKKKDYYLVSLIGFLVGWLVFIPLKNIGFDLNLPWLVFSVVFFTLLAPLALFVLNFLSRFFKVLAQFGKFAAVGTLNTLIDLGILNLFIYLTDISQGLYFSFFKAISFLGATTNSYFWNKFWTFQSRLPVSPREYLRFLFFTFVGTLINVSVASLIVNFIKAPPSFSLKLWANLGALLAVFVSMLWNFLSYKYIVFGRNKN